MEDQNNSSESQLKSDQKGDHTRKGKAQKRKRFIQNKKKEKRKSKAK